jgi:flagellar hook-basal body complex protein FliE
MSAITALVNTNLSPAEIQPFAPRLELFEQPPVRDSNPFSDAFSAAMSMIGDTNTIIAEFEQAQLDFATGRLDDILAVQMAQDRANNALNFTSQVTNRIIEAYREIMRMQI